MELGPPSTVDPDAVCARWLGRLEQGGRLTRSIGYMEVAVFVGWNYCLGL